jgi:hypothetical protein
MTSRMIANRLSSISVVDWALTTQAFPSVPQNRNHQSINS